MLTFLPYTDKLSNASACIIHRQDDHERIAVRSRVYIQRSPGVVFHPAGVDSACLIIVKVRFLRVVV